MANIKEIQDRMRSIQDTLKITNAMYMIPLLNSRSQRKCLPTQSRISLLYSQR